MQPLIVLVASILSVTSGAQLSPLPYAYLVDPLPVYHQSQDTRTGEHAYSYSGGPSAKEEVKGPDGVTRGSYSYVDAHGILQSVFYVADENGFRVAATNLPTDADLPQPEAAKVDDDGESVDASSSPVSRKRRSLDLAGPILLPEFAPTATSQQSRFQVHKSVRIEAPVERQDIENPVYVLSELAPKDLEKQQVSVVAASTEPVYSPVVSHVPLATSHQSRFQVHNNIRLEAPDLQDISSPVYVEQVPNDSINIAEQKPEVKIEASQPISSQEEALQVPSTISQQSQVRVATELEEPAKLLIENAPVQLNRPLYQSIPYSVPLATSHQSRYQIHKSVRVEGPEVPALELNEHAVPVENHVEQVPVLGYPAYHEGRIALHRALGLEGPGAKNAIKIHQAPVAAVAPAVATIVEESIPIHPVPSSVVTAYSNQRRIQVHRNDRIELEQPLLREVVAEQHVPLAVPSVLATAYSNQRRTQVHQNNKIQLEQPTLATFDKLDALYAH